MARPITSGINNFPQSSKRTGPHQSLKEILDWKIQVNFTMKESCSSFDFEVKFMLQNGWQTYEARRLQHTSDLVWLTLFIIDPLKSFVFIEGGIGHLLLQDKS